MNKVAPSDISSKKDAEVNVILERPFPMLGISLHGIRQFIDTIGGRDVIGTQTTTEICEKYVKPITSQKQCSYCDFIQSGDAPSPHCSTAQVFISHAWKYRFNDVFDALCNHFHTEESIYLWFDLFSNNQHGLSEPPPFSWWCNTFMTAIHSMHRVVMVMAPWENPIPLTRAWCLWEVYCTNATGATFEVAMSQRERERFRSMIISDSDVFYDMLGNVDVRNSEAFNPQDKAQIFDVVESEVGFVRLNDLVNQCMRNWVTTEMNAYALECGSYDFSKLVPDDIESNSTNNCDAEAAVMIQCTLARVLSRADRCEEAITMMNTLCNTLKPYPLSFAYAMSTVYLAYVVHESFHNKVLLPPYMPPLSRALNYERQRFETGTIEGWLKRYVSQRNFRVARSVYIAASKSIYNLKTTDSARKDLHSKVLCDVALSFARLLNMNIYEREDRAAKYAVNYHAEAVDTAIKKELEDNVIRKLRCGLAEAQSELAFRHAVEGNYSEALPLLKQSVVDLRMLLSEYHPTTLRACTRLADIYNQLDFYALAKETYEKCLEQTLEKFGHRHPLYLALVSKVRDLRIRHGNVWMMFYDRYLYGMIMVFRKQYGMKWYYRWTPDPVLYAGFTFTEKSWPKTSVGQFIYFVIHFTLTWTVVLVLLVPMIFSQMLHYQLPTLSRRLLTCCMTEDGIMRLYSSLGYNFRNEIHYTEMYLLLMHFVKVFLNLLVLFYIVMTLPPIYHYIGIFFSLAHILPIANLVLKSREVLEKKIPPLHVDADQYAENIHFFN